MPLTQPSGDFMEINRLDSMVRVMKAEREMCIQDVATFKKLREGIRDRKPKFWFITN
jgi:hypothetical protein